MDGKRLIEKIRLRNILSFGDKGEEIELLPLNVIIGQNASGKSNLVDAIKLLKAASQNNEFANQIVEGGGIREWIWKGNRNDEIAELEVDILSWSGLVNYLIRFQKSYTDRIKIVEEVILDKNTKDFLTREKVVELYQDLDKRVGSEETILPISYKFSNQDTLLDSILFLTINLPEMKIYSDLQTSRNSNLRKPQFTDAQNKFLDEDGSNLSLVLNDLEHKRNTYEIIVENLKKFYPRILGYAVKVYSGTVQLFMREEDLDESISAMRLSDGTLHYLCLLAILCHPEPPPLICIEEPEIGLHPDILPTIAELMKEARQRTQLIVTTHSDILVSAFSDMPEAVLVCEKDEDGTHFKRLEADKLKVWLEEYTLGEAWLRGAFGGTRW